MGRKQERRTEGEGWSLVRSCARCGRPETECRCDGASSGGSSGEDRGPAIVRLRLEKRRGKPTTVLAAEGLTPETLAELHRELKATCATGGGAKGLEAVLQGDHRERVRAHLASRGIRVKG